MVSGESYAWKWAFKFPQEIQALSQNNLDAYTKHNSNI